MANDEMSIGEWVGDAYSCFVDYSSDTMSLRVRYSCIRSGDDNFVPGLPVNCLTEHYETAVR